MTPQERKAMERALEALESCTPADTSTGHVVWPSYDEQAVEQAITALRQALEQQPADDEPVACRDEMCACRGGPCTSCPDGEREKELADMRDSRDFYKRRTDELQKAQSQMRDPERTMVCDILANGRLLVPAAGRYNTSPPASKPWAGLTDEQKFALCKQFPDHLTFNAIDAIEAKLKEKNNG